MISIDELAAQLDITPAYLHRVIDRVQATLYLIDGTAQVDPITAGWLTRLVRRVIEPRPTPERLREEFTFDERNDIRDDDIASRYA